MSSKELEKRSVSVVTLDTPEGRARALASLTAKKIIVAHFGCTNGTVTAVGDREEAATKRQERRDKPLAISSVFAPADVAFQMYPVGEDAMRFFHAIERMTNIGFVRHRYDPRSLALNRASAQYKKDLEKYCVNKQGEIQVFPMREFPLADAYAQEHPYEPFLAVRSANVEGKQEQATLSGAISLSRKMELDEVFWLSEASRLQAEHDQEIQMANGLSVDLEGFAVGNYGSYEEMTQKRWGSVPIISIGTNSADFTIERIGNVHPETMVHILTDMSPGYSVHVVEGTERAYRTQYEVKDIANKSWKQALMETIAVGQLAAARR